MCCSVGDALERLRRNNDDRDRSDPVPAPEEDERDPSEDPNREVGAGAERRCC